MAPIVKRKVVPTKPKKPVFDATLPTGNHTPLNDLHDFTFLIYGEPKIGKSSLAGQFPDAFFMFFEPGGKSIAQRQKYVPDWNAALEVLEQLEANPSYCKLVVIDTGFAAFERCYDYALDTLGLDKPSDGDWGEAWKVMDKEFKKFHERLFALGLGFIVTAHSELVTVKKKNGLEHTKLRTMLGKQAWRFYNGIVDVIAYYEYDADKNRVLTIRGNADLEAGCRISDHFRFSDNDKPVEMIPMGEDEKEAFHNFKAAFENKLSSKGVFAQSKAQTKTPALTSGGSPTGKKYSRPKN